MEAETIEQLKHYLKNLQRIITNEKSFKFAGRSLIKKNKIDDVYVCFLSFLPNSFKTAVGFSKFEKVSSVIYYKTLFDSIKGKCMFSSDMYLVQHDKAISCIQGLMKNLEKDLGYIEKNL